MLVTIILIVVALYLAAGLVLAGHTYYNGFTLATAVVWGGLAWLPVLVYTNLVVRDQHWVCKRQAKPWLRRRGRNTLACRECCIHNAGL